MTPKLPDFVNAINVVPVLGPIIRVLYSRKGVVASLLTAGLVAFFPALSKVASEAEAVMAVIVAGTLVWIAQIIGVAIEDAARLRGRG